MRAASAGHRCGLTSAVHMDQQTQPTGRSPEPQMRVTGPPILLSYFVTVFLDEPSSTTLINQQLIKPQWVQQKPQKGMALSPHPC